MNPEDSYFPGGNDFLFSDPVDDENDRINYEEHEWEEREAR